MADTKVHDELQPGGRSTPSESSARAPDVVRDATVAQHLAPVLARLFVGAPPAHCQFWDESELGDTTGPGTIRVRSPRALTYLLWSPDELGFARAFVTGEIDIDGDLFSILDVLHRNLRVETRRQLRSLPRVLFAAYRSGALRRPLPRPPEEVRLSGWRHSKRRDAVAIAHHYDVSNEFYRLVLGPAMTYSCAYFERTEMSLEHAQRAKHDLVCRKLGLHERPNACLLDVGCGWGSMALHAAERYGAHVVGITLSAAQAQAARRRVLDAGLEGQVEIQLLDYRDLRGEHFDAISSIGMFEHVGSKNMHEYFDTLHSLLTPHGRLLNHAISTPGGSKLRGRTFTNRYVFPDGELIDVADVVAAMERAGFEVRDVESLREHYSATLHAWVSNLAHSWDDAVQLVGEARARVWRLYMAASANGFDDAGLAVHQVLGVVPNDDGRSGMPRTRSGWLARPVDNAAQRALRTQHRKARPRSPRRSQS